MKLLIREITNKSSNRKYRIYVKPYSIYYFSVYIKVRYVFMWFIPIWKTLKDTGGVYFPPKIIEFKNYHAALKYITELEELNNRFYEKDNPTEEKMLTEK